MAARPSGASDIYWVKFAEGVHSVLLSRWGRCRSSVVLVLHDLPRDKKSLQPAWHWDGFVRFSLNLVVFYSSCFATFLPEDILKSF